MNYFVTRGFYDAVVDRETDSLLVREPREDYVAAEFIDASQSVEQIVRLASGVAAVAYH